MSEAIGELAVIGLFSWGGEAMKHSSRDPRLLETAEEPLPNLKVDNGFSALAVLRETDVVDDPLVLANDGRSSVDRLRLVGQESVVSLSILLSTLTQGNWVLVLRQQAVALSRYMPS